MSDSDVHPDEMPTFPRFDDADLEAFLAGRASAADTLAPLALFTEDLGLALRGPAPAPKADLATLLVEGFSTEKGDVPVTSREKSMPITLRSRLVAKLAGFGLAAKVGLGVGVAAASVTGAGAAGVLPDAVQDAVVTAVETVTPFEFPEHANPHSDFGAIVSSDATGASDGIPGVDGQAVADAARQKGGKPGTDTDAAEGNGAPGSTGSTGLARANETPAAGHVPTSLPTPSNPGAQGSTGLDKANQAPAAGHVPTSLPTPTSVPPQGSTNAGSQGSTGLDKANETPAAGRAPASAGRP